MYFRHDLVYQYPEKCDEHMISVKHLRDVNLDEDYPYLQKSVWFCCQRGLLWVCQYTVLPITFSFRPSTGLWKLLGKSPLVDLNIGDPIFYDKDLPKPAAIKKCSAMPIILCRP